MANRTYSLLCALLIACTGMSASAETLLLGTATKGGGFELYGRHLVAVLAETEPNLNITIRATRGSAENLPLLEDGKLDVGLVEGNAAYAAFQGIGRPKTPLRVIAVTYPGPGMFVVRADSPYQTISDLKGKTVAFGTPASGLTKLGRTVLDGLGLSPERDFQPVFLQKAGDGPTLVLDGKVAALWGGGIGWPGFVKIADSASGARFIVPNADEIRLIIAKHPQLRPMTIPAGTYTGQMHELPSVGQWSYVLARADLPEATAYRLARAMHQGESKLAERLPQGRYTTAKNTTIEVPINQLHPGAVRYLREMKLLP